VQLCFFAHSPSQLRVTARSAAQNGNNRSSAVAKTESGSESPLSSSSSRCLILQAPDAPQSLVPTPAAAASLPAARGPSSPAGTTGLTARRGSVDQPAADNDNAAAAGRTCQAEGASSSAAMAAAPSTGTQAPAAAAAAAATVQAGAAQQAQTGTQVQTEEATAGATAVPAVIVEAAATADDAPNSAEPAALQVLAYLATSVRAQADSADVDNAAAATAVVTDLTNEGHGREEPTAPPQTAQEAAAGDAATGMTTGRRSSTAGNTSPAYGPAAGRHDAASIAGSPAATGSTTSSSGSSHGSSVASDGLQLHPPAAHVQPVLPATPGSAASCQSASASILQGKALAALQKPHHPGLVAPASGAIHSSQMNALLPGRALALAACDDFRSSIITSRQSPMSSRLSGAPCVPLAGSSLVPLAAGPVGVSSSSFPCGSPDAQLARALLNQLTAQQQQLLLLRDQQQQQQGVAVAVLGGLSPAAAALTAGIPAQAAAASAAPMQQQELLEQLLLQQQQRSLDVQQHQQLMCLLQQQELSSIPVVAEQVWDMLQQGGGATVWPMAEVSSAHNPALAAAQMWQLLRQESLLLHARQQQQQQQQLVLQQQQQQLVLQQQQQQQQLLHLELSSQALLAASGPAAAPGSALLPPSHVANQTRSASHEAGMVQHNDGTAWYGLGLRPPTHY